MKMFTAALLLASIGSIMGLKCYTCTYGAAGITTNTDACMDPFDASGANVVSIDCSVIDPSFDVCAKTVANVNGVTTAARTCFSSTLCPASNGCKSASGATVCCCNGNDCNGAGSVAVNIVATVTVVIAAVMFTV